LDLGQNNGPPLELRSALSDIEDFMLVVGMICQRAVFVAFFLLAVGLIGPGAGAFNEPYAAEGQTDPYASSWADGLDVEDCLNGECLIRSGHGSVQHVYDGRRINLRHYSFDPLGDLPSIPPQLASSDRSLLHIVQFTGPVGDMQVRLLQSAGVSVFDYIPNNAYVCSVPPGIQDDLKRMDGAFSSIRSSVPFHPAFRYDPDRFSDKGMGYYVKVTDNGDLDDDLARLGFPVTFSTDCLIHVMCTEAMAKLMLLRDDVLWVEAASPNSPANSVAVHKMNARQNNDGPWRDDGTAFWSWNPSRNRFEGYTGKGVVVAVVDWGIDGSHPDFQGKKVAYYNYVDPGGAVWVDKVGHGTHTSGSVIGNGISYPNDRTYAGMAPEALLVGQEIGDTTITNPLVLCTDAVVQGAVASSNSWGIPANKGTYGIICEYYDKQVISTQGKEISVVFSAGNDGNKAKVSEPGTAKNIITVGAVDGSYYDIYGFSQAGTNDGRIKPDVVAVATVTSCYPESMGGIYVVQSGTSMATPFVTGSIALMEEYFKEEYGTSPSPALAKALLINGATPLYPDQWPYAADGWGVINMRRSIFGESGAEVSFADQTESLHTGDSRYYTFQMNQNGYLRITLDWSDEPASPSASKTLVNNLDMTVRSPDGIVYSGNMFENGESVPSMKADEVNNVEGLMLTNASAGIWSISVKGTNVPKGPQDYALVVYGDHQGFQKSRSDVSFDGGLKIESPGDVPAEGDRAWVVAEIDHDGVGILPYLPYRLEDRLSNGTVFSIENHTGHVSPDDPVTIRIPWHPLAGDHVLTLFLDPDGLYPEDDVEDNSAELSVHVGRYAIDPEIRTAVHLTPLTPTVFDWVLRNTGDLDENFTISMDGIPLDLTVELGGEPSPHAVFIPAGVSMSVEVIVDSKTIIPQWEHHFIKVNVTPQHRPEARSSSIWEIKIDPLRDIRLSTDRWDISAKPGETEHFVLYVENRGNLNESLMLKTSEEYPVFIDVASWDLKPTDEGYTDVDVEFPQDASADDPVQLHVWAESSDGFETDPVLLNLTPEVVHSVEMELKDSRFMETSPGDGLVLEFDIINGGNVMEDMDLSVSWQETGEVYEQVQNEKVDPFSTRPVSMMVDVPDDLPAGESELLVMAASGKLSYSLEFVLDVRSVPSYDLDFDPDKAFVERDGDTRVSLLLTNTGNTRGSVDLVISGLGPDVSVSLDERSPNLGIDDQQTIKMDLKATSDALMGRYRVTVTLWGPDPGYDGPDTTFVAIEDESFELEVGSPGGVYGDLDSRFENDGFYDLTDSDGDGLPDWWESREGLDPEDPTDATGDEKEKFSTSRSEELDGFVSAHLNMVMAMILVVAAVVVGVVILIKRRKPIKGGKVDSLKSFNDDDVRSKNDAQKETVNARSKNSKSEKKARPPKPDPSISSPKSPDDLNKP